MGSRSWFGRKEQKPVKVEKKPEELGLLEELCKGDAELFGALYHTVLLHPQRVQKDGINSYVEKAQQFEKKKDFLRARVNYQVAGEIALYEGNLKQVQTFFGKCEELEENPEYKKVFEYYSKYQNAALALEKAKEYYAKISQLQLEEEAKKKAS